MPRLVVTALVVLLAGAAPAAAAPHDVLEVLGRDAVAELDRSTPLPVLLPGSLDLDVDGPVYATAAGARRAWSVTIAAAPDCAANACLLATLDAQRGGTLAFRRRVRITPSVRGSYKPLTCGASCSPPTIDFVRRGVRYAIQAKLAVSGDAAQRDALVRAARSALRAGPRR